MFEKTSVQYPLAWVMANYGIFIKGVRLRRRIKYKNYKFKYDSYLYNLKKKLN